MDRIDELRLFTDIASAGSLAGAARRHGLAPSTVTTALSRLEHRLGAKLLVRSTRRMSLTSEGERFVEDCRRILGDLAEAEAALSRPGALQGRISVTAPNDFGRTRLASLIDAFLLEHPSVEIRLLLSDAIIDIVGDGIDVAIRVGPLADSDLRARRLVSGNLVVCAAPSYWNARGRPTHPRELEAGHNCMALARSGAAPMSWRFMEDGRVFPIRVLGNRAANDGGVLHEWALAGTGCIVKASWDVADDLVAGRLETVLDSFATPGSDLFAVHAAARSGVRRVETFLAHLTSGLSHNFLVR